MEGRSFWQYSKASNPLRASWITTWGENFLIIISDTGPGIPENILTDFGKMQMQSTKDKGNGLGVYQAKKAVEDHGGIFEVLSDSQNGTKITLKFPLGNKENPAYEV